MSYAVIRLHGLPLRTQPVVEVFETEALRIKGIQFETSLERNRSTIRVRGRQRGILGAMHNLQQQVKAGTLRQVRCEIDGPHGDDDDDLFPEEEAHLLALSDGTSSL